MAKVLDIPISDTIHTFGYIIGETGRAEFIDKLGKSFVFRNSKWADLPPNTMITARFTINDTRRKLMSWSPIAFLGVHVQASCPDDYLTVSTFLSLFKSMSSLYDWGGYISRYFAIHVPDTPMDFHFALPYIPPHVIKLLRDGYLDGILSFYSIDPDAAHSDGLEYDNVSFVDLGEEPYYLEIKEVYEGKINLIKKLRWLLPSLGLKDAKEAIENGIIADYGITPSLAAFLSYKYRKLADLKILNKLDTETDAAGEPEFVEEYVDEEDLQHSIPSSKPDDVATEIGFPEWVNGHWISSEIRKNFAVVSNIVQAGGSVNVLMKGPSGYGKTSSFKALADYLGYKYIRINCAVVLDTEQWFGYQEAKNGETVFIPSELSEALMEGNAVIVLDEGNRIEPWLMGPLFPILDHERKTNVHMLEINVGPSVVIGMTINEGSRFTGTFSVDAALLNRFDIGIDVHPLPMALEKQLLMDKFDAEAHVAAKIVSVITRIRHLIESEELSVDASTRSSLKIARLTSAGMSIKDAFYSVIVAFAPQEERKSIIDIIESES